MSLLILLRVRHIYHGKYVSVLTWIRRLRRRTVAHALHGRVRRSRHASADQASDERSQKSLRTQGRRTCGHNGEMFRQHSSLPSRHRRGGRRRRGRGKRARSRRRRDHPQKQARARQTRAESERPPRQSHHGGASEAHPAQSGAEFRGPVAARHAGKEKRTTRDARAARSGRCGRSPAVGRRRRGRRGRGKSGKERRERRRSPPGRGDSHGSRSHRRSSGGTQRPRQATHVVSLRERLLRPSPPNARVRRRARHRVFPAKMGPVLLPRRARGLHSILSLHAVRRGSPVQALRRRRHPAGSNRRVGRQRGTRVQAHMERAIQPLAHFRNLVEPYPQGFPTHGRAYRAIRWHGRGGSTNFSVRYPIQRPFR